MLRLRALLQKRQFAAALADAETLRKQVPENRDVWYIIAVSQRYLQRIPDALTTLARLEQSLAIQRHTLRDPVHFLICDREFHLAIYRSSANPLLADFAIDLYTYMLDHRRAAVSRPGAIRKSHGDHIKIVSALRERDAGAVVAAFTRHIDRIYDTTVSILEEREGNSRGG